MATVIDDADIIAVCNQSLGLLGAEQIELNGSGTNHDLCTLFYEDSRDEILISHPWNYARKRANAIETTNPIFEYDYAYTSPSDSLRILRVSYDPLAEFRVEGSTILTDEYVTPDDWATATDYIVGQVVTNDDVTYTCKQTHTSGDADDEPGVGALTDTYWTSHSDDLLYLPVEYIYQATTIASYPAFLKQCVVYNLALKLAPAIRQDEKTSLNLQQMLYGGPQVVGYLGMARSLDAQESAVTEIKTQKWIDSRTQ